MLFSSLEFLFFFLPLVLAGVVLLKPQFINYFLLLASLFFYAWGEPDFVIALVVVVVVDYLLAYVIAWRQSMGKTGKTWLIFAIITNISLLFWYKYLNFFTRTLGKIFGEGIPTTSIALPIGISFFIFQALSYVIDVYRKECGVQKNPFYVCLYVSLFPQLIAGPIVRYTTIAEEIAVRTTKTEDYALGIKRFIAGLSKKVILANSFAVVADKAFSSAVAGTLSLAFSWLGIIAYSFQIFFDFSGYSDMAIGLGRMFGFHFLENFNYPYSAKSISEFWRRWHISLSTWFRDYVYFPLGGSRVKNKKRLICNLLIVWGLTGLWHGANWTFIFWGFFYFLLITFEKLTRLPQRFSHHFSTELYRLFTLFCVIFGWVLFRAEDIWVAKAYIKCLLGISGNPVLDDVFLFHFNEIFVLLLFAFLLSVPFFPWFHEQLERFPMIKRFFPYAINVVYLFLFILSVSFLVVGGHNPFIYFNF